MNTYQHLRALGFVAAALLVGCQHQGAPTEPNDLTLELRRGGGDKDKGGYFTPVDFPGALQGGGVNGMIANPHDQTLKTGSGRKYFVNGFNPEYLVAMNLVATSAAGVGPCVLDPKRDPGNWDDARLAALLGDPVRARYTIVRVGYALGASDPVHEIQAQGTEATVALEGAPTVVFTASAAGGKSGTYTFSGGTLKVIDTAGGIYSVLRCPNLDVVEVVFDFTSP